MPEFKFLQHDAAGGVVLVLAAVLAMVAANSQAATLYNALLETNLTAGFAPLVLTKTVLHWINDGLMAVFFFLIGLEIKREFLAGALSSAKSAALPAIAALGGMLVPAPGALAALVERCRAHGILIVCDEVKVGLARTGSTARHSSGDFMLAFSTANVISHYPKESTYQLTHLADTHLNPLISATVEATEEAILNALTMATTVTGRDGHRIEAIDLGRLQTLLSGSR